MLFNNLTSYKIFFLFFFLFFLRPVFFYGQEKIIQRKINWNKNIAIKHNPAYHNNQPKLQKGNGKILNIPVYTEKFRLANSFGSQCQAEFLREDFESVAKEEYADVQESNEVANEIIPEYHISFERKSPYFILSFVPFRKNPSTGKLEKLKSYSLKVSSKNPKPGGKKVYRNYSSHSVLSSGLWLKISISEDGIYSISFDKLKEEGFDQPQDIRLFGNGSGMLPQNSSLPYYDDLRENAIWVYQQAIYFYAQGPVKWTYDSTWQEFTHELNNYTKTCSYFLTEQSGIKKRISISPVVQATGVIDVSSFNDYVYHEKEITNLLKSGSEWYGEEFDDVTGLNLKFIFPGIQQGASLVISDRFVARASDPSSYTVQVNGTTVQQINMTAVILDNPSLAYASVSSARNIIQAQTDTVSVDISYNKPANMPSAIGWLDFVRLNTRRKLIYHGSQMKFRDIQSVGTKQKASFHIQNPKPGLHIWDITHPSDIIEIPANLNGSLLDFTVHTDSLKEFIIFDPATCISPVISGPVANQDLHSCGQPDLVIITHPDFLESAIQLANEHKNNDHLNVVLATTSQVYNEFSSGSPDISAIRNFMKMLYDRATSQEYLPHYLLLVGDGSYDNISDSPGNTNYILTYQSDNSLVPTESYVSDDYFGLLDDGENISTGLLDIGVGRLPVKSSLEAQNVVNKIIHYQEPASYGNWRNKLCFTADDGDNNLHLSQAESMAGYVDMSYSAININKIYLDAYPQETGPSGEICPMAEEAISNTINRGCLIFNYTGHGSETGLTAEHIVSLSDIGSWTNFDHLPLFMTATCEFSRFDNYSEVSGGELVLLNPNGGAIGLFTTTRLMYSTPNYLLNKIFYEYVFSDSTNTRRAGDIMRLTKNDAGSSVNKLNFTLLCDPALRIAYPVMSVVTDKINNLPADLQKDTLKPGGKITISGHIVDKKGNMLSSFNGTIWPEIYDKPLHHITLGTEGDDVYDFYTQENIIFKGKASVKDGRFSFTFIAPRDINPGIGSGKISYYADNVSVQTTMQKTDAGGYYRKLLIGGSLTGTTHDKLGPEIVVKLDNENFNFGGITGPDPELIIRFTDSSGINATGNGIGHDITAIIDNNTSSTIVLNDYYEADLDSYQSGRVEYKLSGLSDGSHSIRVKAWDVFNNPSEAYIEFFVSSTKELFIDHLFNYPNPFTNNTTFYFSHNLDNQEVHLLIRIFTVSGKFVKSLESTILAEKGKLAGLSWDGLDDFGNRIGRGVYFYKVTVRTNYGSTVEKTDKLVILK
ncbi:MAG: type IX secretion system sortase PorU [Bacteroidia bacterium]|nr:type IX secretion system sortase PorU [Bacteroidia bacterium]